MPVACCFYKKGIDVSQGDAIAESIADLLKIDIKDIHLSFIESGFQAGQKYAILMQLELPSLWNAENIERIQLGFLDALLDHFSISKEQIFITTRIIQSGHVVENGQIQRW